MPCFIKWLLVVFVAFSCPGVRAQVLQPRAEQPVLILPEEDRRRLLDDLQNTTAKDPGADENETAIPVDEDTAPEENDIDGGGDESWAPLESDPVGLEPMAYRDLVSFRNGDYLAGQLQFWDSASSTIHWLYPESSQPFAMDPANIDKILLEPRTDISDSSSTPIEQSAEDGHGWRFFFTTGETLDGFLEEITDSAVTLRSQLTGTISVPRKFVESIYPNYSGSEALYRGPDTMDGWTRGDVRLEQGEGGQWRYNRNAFYATEAASIARDVGLTPLSSIEIEAAWKGTLNFAVALYTDYLQPIRLADKENEPDFGPFYSLQIGSQSARLQSINKDDPIRQLGYAFIPTLNQKTQAKFTILSNSRTATVTLLVDDQRVHTWRDTQGFYGEGGAIRIVHQGMGSIRLGSVVVRKWNGIIDSTNDRQVRYRTDVIQAEDGETFKGSLSSLRNGSASMFLANSSTRKLQIGDIHSIHFRATEWKVPRDRGENTILEFYSDEMIKAALHRLDGTGLFMEHAIFGRHHIPSPAGIRSIRVLSDASRADVRP
jgi:hypothetical protein